MTKIKLSRQQKTGLFAILIFLSIYVVINYLQGKDLFSGSYTYHAVYHDVEGLTSTGPVYIRGYKVGFVESINFNQDKDHFLVKFRINKKYKLPRNSSAEIYSADLLGTKAVRINLSNENALLGNKDTLLSSTETGMIDMLVSEIMPLKDDITGLISTLNATLENVNDILNPQAKKDIAESLESLRNTLNSTKIIAGNLEKSSPEIPVLMENLNNLTSRLNTTAQKLNNGLDNVTEITESLKESDIAGTLTALKELLLQINNPEGTMGKLLHTDSLHSSIDRLVNDLEELVKNINNNPKKYIRVTIF